MSLGPLIVISEVSTAPSMVIGMKGVYVYIISYISFHTKIQTEAPIIAD